MSFAIKPIATIHNDFKEKFGIPRQSGRVSSIKSKIVFEPEFRVKEALRGIEEFSHLWLIFDFSESHRADWSPTVRPPRLGGNKRVGVFASRSPFRPNSMGLSCVKLIEVKSTEDEGDILIVSGADLLDNTPIYDIKPYVPYSDCIPNALGSYAEDNKEHQLNVVFKDDYSERFSADFIDAVKECIADDPRPSYQNDGLRVYKMRFGDCDISFTVHEDTATVLEIKN